MLQAEQRVNLPPAGEYAVGQMFLPRDDAEQRAAAKKIVEAAAASLGHETLAWRTVPTDNSLLGDSAIKVEPVVEQVFLSAQGSLSHLAVEQQLYVLRKFAEGDLLKAGFTADDAYFCSLSAATVVYKGQLTPEQVPLYYADLARPEFRAYMAIVHSRFSTNTFPSWNRAQPMRMLGHNGEINTLRGNRNWLRSREGVVACAALGLTPEQVARLTPVVAEWQSDSGSFDSVLELLTRTGRDIAEVRVVFVFVLFVCCLLFVVCLFCVCVLSV